jgi:pimeloyl-ACP methyl ester carboxylesterase
MADFLLIHGSGHGAWAWRDVIPRLRDLGHEARAIDLPGHGEDRTPLEAIRLETYRDAILSALGDRTVLVGHSMGGYPITAAAEAAPARIAALVYLCAYVPVAGVSLADMRRAGPRQPLAPAIRRAEDGLSFTFDPAMARDLFYHDCPDEAVAFATARLCRQPVLPQETPLDATARAEGCPATTSSARTTGRSRPSTRRTWRAPHDQTLHHLRRHHRHRCRPRPTTRRCRSPWPNRWKARMRRSRPAPPSRTPMCAMTTAADLGPREIRPPEGGAGENTAPA